MSRRWSRTDAKTTLPTPSYTSPAGIVQAIAERHEEPADIVIYSSTGKVLRRLDGRTRREKK